MRVVRVVRWTVVMQPAADFDERGEGGQTGGLAIGDEMRRTERLSLKVSGRSGASEAICKWLVGYLMCRVWEVVGLVGGH